MTSEWEYRVNRNLRRLLRCSIKGCMKTNGLHFAHVNWSPIIPNGKGRGEAKRLLDLIKYPRSYLVLCKNHHKQVDGQLSWKHSATTIVSVQDIKKRFKLQSPLRRR